MICRSFHCNGITFDENTCKITRINYNAHCLVVSVKLTFFGNPLPVQELDENQLWYGLKRDFAKPPLNAQQIKDIKVYIEIINQDGMFFIDYLIVQLFITGTVTRDNTLDLEAFVNHVHKRRCYIGIENLFPMCEVVLDDAAIVPDQELDQPVTEPTPDVKRSVPSDYCNNRNLHFVHKLFFCLHVKLRETELHMEINNNVLFITISSNVVFRFSPWEYEFANETLKLCMEDYLKIYNAMPSYMNSNSLIDNKAKMVECHVNAMTIPIIFYHFF